MEIPGERKRRTLKNLPHCESVFSGIEKLLLRNPDSCPEIHNVNNVSYRYYAMSTAKRVHIRQHIPRIRLRYQYNRISRKILIDQLAVYDHEMHEIYTDED